MCPVFVSGPIWLRVCLWFGKPSSSAHQSLSLWEKREWWGDICEKITESRTEWSWWKRRWNRCQKPFSHTMRQKQRHDGPRLNSVNSFFFKRVFASSTRLALHFFNTVTKHPPPLTFASTDWPPIQPSSHWLMVSSEGENAFHSQGHRLCLLQVCLGWSGLI